MGLERSLSVLVDRYQTGTKPAPTKRLTSLKEWSVKFNWQERASAYDAQLDAEKTARIASERALVMEEGLALDFERVRRLKRLADDLEQQIFYECELITDDDGEPQELHPIPPGMMQVKKRPHLWVRDEKGIGRGAEFKRVVTYRYNSQLVSDYRGVLDDLAKETGGRAQRTESVDMDNLSATQLEALSKGMPLHKVLTMRDADTSGEAAE